MKNIKKLLVAVLTFALSFIGMSLVMAEDATNPGSIVVSGTTKDRAYEIYKIFDLTYSGENVAYTIDDSWVEFFNGNGVEYIVSSESDGLNQITIGNTTKYINITEDNIEEFTKEALEYVALKKLAADSKMVASGETTTFTNLELGYYLVYPEGAVDKKSGSICSITSTLPSAEVEIKADYPTIDKVGNGSSLEVGSYAEFTITGNVPDTTGYTNYVYRITDNWTAGLELDSQVNFTITIGGNEITDVEPVYINNNTGFTLEFDMTEYQSGDFSIGDEIVVSYKLRVTKDAIDSTTTHNIAYLTYSINPKNEETLDTPEIKVEIYSAKIEVLKVDGETRVELAGAKFVLQNEAGDYYHVLTMTDDNKIATFEWVADINSATVFESNEDGIAVSSAGLVGFQGLEDGTYYLVETEAPDGYNKLPNPIEVVLEGTVVENRNVAVSQSLTVENNTGMELPSTGGMGTTLFIVIGSILVMVSAIILITNKRMSKEG